MTKAQHTPGPWNFYEDISGFYIGRNPPDYIARVHTHNEKDEPNAKLIAAAPDLLEALEFVKARMGGLTPALQEIVNSAIAKATT